MTEGFICSVCEGTDIVVSDSRPATKMEGIRRRRKCNDCGARFTTFEQRNGEGVRESVNNELALLAKDMSVFTSSISDRIRAFEQAIWEML